MTPEAEILGGQRAGVYGHASMATDGKNVVWIDATNGVLETPLVGAASAAPITLQATTNSQLGWGDIAMAGGVVVWSAWDANNPMMLWTAKDGASLKAFGAGSVANSSGDVPSGLALDATGANAYFVDAQNLLDVPMAPGLYQCAVATATCARLHSMAAAPVFGLAGDVAVGAGGAFFTDTAAQTVYRQNVGTVVSQQENPSRVVIDSTSVYWANIDVPDGGDSTFTLRKAPQAAGSSATTLVGPVAAALWGMATDGANVYYAAESGFAAHGGSLLYVPVGGGTPQSLKDGQQAIAVAAAGGIIVWIDNKTNTIDAIAAP